MANDKKWHFPNNNESASCITRRQFLAVGAASLLPLPSLAAEYPERAIRFIIPFAPGGTSDVIARLVTTPAAQTLGQAIVLENLPGATGGIGMRTLAESNPDGYTIGQGATSTLTINPSLFASLPYRPKEDFQPLSLMAVFPNVVVVSATSPYQSIGDLLDDARKHPQKISYGSGGSGTTQHLGPELLKSMTNVSFLHVPYKGMGPAVIALIAGDVTFAIDNAVGIIPHIQSGRLRALAVTSRERIASLPDVPTMKEAGVDGFEVTGWQGIVAPRGLSDKVLARLHGAIDASLRSPEVDGRLRELGAIPSPTTPEEFAKLIQEETVKWAEAVRVSGASVG